LAELVTLSTYYDLPAAVVHRSLLDQHGIPAILFDSHLGGMNWLYLPAMRGVRLMVLERDIDAADRLLADLSEKIDVPEDEHCPACGSDDIFRPASWVLGLLTVLTVGPPLLVKSRRRHCRSCRHNWRGSEGFLV
jgi:hypothetical protein